MTLILFGLVASVMAQVPPAQPPRPEPFAVVELFTSEGCSSCPPADKLLGGLVAGEDTRVFPLAFHVDYWDGLGWKAPYATAAATRRQREYAAGFEGAGLYTPQMIVNGTDEFVGSDRDRAGRSIAAALKAQASVGVLASAAREGDRIVVSAALGPGAAHAVLVAALVQRGLQSRVNAGENAGRRLTHENVVRDFVVEPARSPSVRAELRIPAGAQIKDLGVIVYVQDAKTRRVLGAARAAIASAGAPKP